MKQKRKLVSPFLWAKRCTLVTTIGYNQEWPCSNRAFFFFLFCNFSRYPTINVYANPVMEISPKNTVRIVQQKRKTNVPKMTAFFNHLCTPLYLACTLPHHWTVLYSLSLHEERKKKTFTFTSRARQDLLQRVYYFLRHYFRFCCFVALVLIITRFFLVHSRFSCSHLVPTAQIFKYTVYIALFRFTFNVFI